MVMLQLVALLVLCAQSILAFAPVSRHPYAPFRRRMKQANLKGGDEDFLRLLILVEPSPFTYVCGYSNRFQELFRYLQKRQRNHHNNSNTEVEIVTVEVVEDPKKIPRIQFGFPIHYTRGFRCWFYKRMSLSWDWTYQVLRRIWIFRPNLIHVTSPGLFVVPSLCYARLFQIPVVFSYHTHIPVYIPSYLPLWLAPFAIETVWWWIRFTHSLADLTLVTSDAIHKEFHTRGIKNVKVWQKAVDADRFHPRHYSESMRRRMVPPHHMFNKNISAHDYKTSHEANAVTLPVVFAAEVRTSTFTENGHHEGKLVSPLLLLYVGRLAAEKRIERIRAVLDNTPNSSLCIVGSGPHESFLRNHFRNTSTVFLGELHGTELSQVYASADIFVFPSDSETLGFVVLEAMASEIPVVAANAGGLPNIIDANATTGFLADCDEDYIRFVRQLGEDEQLRKRIASAGRRAAEQWTWNSSMTQVCEDHYKTARYHFDRTWRVRFIRSLKLVVFKLRNSIDIFGGYRTRNS